MKGSTNTIKKMRYKFIGFTMLALFGTLVFLFSAINLINYKITIDRADATINLIYQNGGRLPFNLPSRTVPGIGGFHLINEPHLDTRFFLVQLNNRDDVTFVNMENIATMDLQGIIYSIREIVDGTKDKGFINQYRYRVFSSEMGRTVIVLDFFLQMQSILNMIWVSALVALACLVIVFILLLFLSKKAVRPFVENLELQKQFVTDASHELKTPLTIIAANTSVLEYSIGENEWLKSTQSQVNRLDRLVKNLIELAKLDEDTEQEEFCDISLSGIVRDVISDFKPLIESQSKISEENIELDIQIHGQYEALYQLITILMDNAVKYCDEKGKVLITLAKRGKRAQLSITNTCRELEPTKIQRFFERFYRADSSRSRESGGYGIGLSVAQAIVQKHKGRIYARHSEGEITFTVIL